MNLIKKIKLSLIFLQLSLLALKAQVAQAVASSSALQRFKNVAHEAGYSTTNIWPQTVIVRFLIIALSFIGILFIVVIIYSGFQYMTSGGSEDKIKEAKNRIKYAAIGLIIVLISYSLTVFVYNAVFKSTTTCYYCFP